MELNEKNWFAKYYNWIYDGLPNDVCTFFWGTLLIVLIHPIIIPGRVCKEWGDGFGNYLGKGIACWFGIAILAVFGMPGIQFIFGKEWLNTVPFIWGFLALLLSGIVLIGTIVGIIALILYSVYKYQKYKRNKPYVYIEPTPTIWDKTGDFIGAIRGKYCTKITWKSK